MLAIELKRILKDSIIIFIILAALGAAIVFTDQDDYLAPALEIFLLLYASFTGWSMFERERQENAMEYLLSLPLSRSRLLLLKFLPRLLSVSIMLLLYLRLHQAWQLPSFLSPADFSVLFAGFFLLAVAFSVSLKNFISAFFLTCLLSIGQSLLIKLLDNSRETGQAILQANLTVLIFPLLFFFLFLRYDIKPVSFFNKRFLPGLLFLTGLIAGIIYLNAPIFWNNYFLTKNGLILRNSCQRSEILLEHEKKHFTGCLTALRETADRQSLYCLTREPQPDAPCSNKNIVALNLKTGAAKTLFEIPKGWIISEGYPGEMGSSQDGIYSVFLQNPKLKKAMIIEIRDEQVKQFPISGDFQDTQINYIFYLKSQPRQLVIFSESRLYRLDLSGQVEELAKADSFTVWQDKILMFTADEMNLYQVGEQLTLLQQRKGNYKKSVRRISGYESRGVIYHSDRDYFWLDLEQQKESKLELKSPPYTYQQNGETFNVVFANISIFTMMEICAGKQHETLWEAGFQPSGIRISPCGLLVFKEQEYKVYKFKN